MNRITIALAAGLAAAATAPAQAPSQPGAMAHQAAEPSPAQSFWTRDTLTDDWGGLRKRLEQDGITVRLTYTGEVLADLAGGIKRGAVYQQQVLGTVDADLEKLFGWSGATLHVSAYDYAASGLTEGFVSSIAPISGIEAPPPSVRLFTLWLQQQSPDGRVSLKAGVLALDEEEFTYTVPAQLFVGATFGYPDGVAPNLPASGPVYPLSAPAVLLEVKPVPTLKLRGAVFSGDPTGHGGFTNPPEDTPYGTVIALSGGALITAEAVLTANPQQEGVATRFRLGGWYHTGNHFADEHLASNGVSLAAPNSTGVPRYHSGDWAVYATGEATLCRVPGTKDQGLAVFARLAGLPAAQNLVSLYADGGLTYKGLLPGRPDDTAGIAFAYFGISPSAQALDRDTRRFGDGPGYPIRSREILIELTYQAQLAAWWRLQPFLQYDLRPGGGIPDPVNPVRTISNATVLGLRTSVAF